LEEQLANLGFLRTAQHVGPFLSSICEFERLLQYLQDTLDALLMCQGTWQTLEPIFSSSEAIQQLPVEGQLFQQVIFYIFRSSESSIRHAEIGAGERE
jgi:Dynein heavy chain, N-terminal region 2